MFVVLVNLNLLIIIIIIYMYNTVLDTPNKTETQIGKNMFYSIFI